VLRVHRPEPAVRPGPEPRDVLADRVDLPPLHGRGRREHGEVRLAARAGERAAHVRDLAVWALDADDEHVLGEPALAPPDVARDAERHALLGEEGVPAVARAHAPDGAVV